VPIPANSLNASLVFVMIIMLDADVLALVAFADTLAVVVIQFVVVAWPAGREVDALWKEETLAKPTAGGCCRKTVYTFFYELNISG
jgi:hypothetical protein